MKRVLIIEKDALTAQRMGSLWEDAGYESRIVTEKSRAAFEAGQWRPDLITLDLEGAGAEEEGREVLLQLQSRPQTSRTPVLVFSNKGRGAIPAPLLRSVRTVVEKSIRFQELLEKTPDLTPATVQ